MMNKTDKQITHKYTKSKTEIFSQEETTVNTNPPLTHFRLNHSF